jgi:hypothetical protein
MKPRRFAGTAAYNNQPEKRHQASPAWRSAGGFSVSRAESRTQTGKCATDRMTETNGIRQ